MLSDLAPKVTEALRVPCPPPIEVWLLDDEIAGPADARTTLNRIEIGKEALGQERWVLAHEYAHWCIAHAPRGRWNELPHILVEGLAEFAAARALPDLADEAEAGHRHALGRLVGVDSLDQAFAMRVSEWGEIESDDLLRVLYAMGFVMAVRLGPDNLARLCTDFKDSSPEELLSSRILGRTGLQSASPQEWNEALEKAWAQLRAN